MSSDLPAQVPESWEMLLGALSVSEGDPKPSPPSPPASKTVESYDPPGFTTLTLDANPDKTAPVLLVNVTAFLRAGSNSSSSYEKTTSETVEMLRSALLGQFRARSAQLFAMGCAYHSTEGRAADDMADLSALLGQAQLIVVQTPPLVQGLPAEVLWDCVVRETGTQCVDFVKDGIREAQADLVWKADWAAEIERLAAREELEMMERQWALERAATLSVKQEALAEELHSPGLTPARREAIRAELASLAEDIRALEDRALDMDNEPEEGEPSLMEVLLDVIFDRHPSIDGDPSHKDYIAKTKEFLLNAWEDHFGRLPRASKSLKRQAKQQQQKKEKDDEEVGGSAE